MITDSTQHIHFTGVGGVGMTGLALICRDFGIAVTGTDMAMSRNIDMLRAAGATVEVGHSDTHLQAPDLLVYSSAVTSDNSERTAASGLGIPQQRRGEFLAELAQAFPQRVSCAGSHGKTTTSAMLTHILRHVGYQPGYLIGGQPVDMDRPASAGNRQLLVTEVDESDGTQALMTSTHGIISNIEDDHCWSLGGPDKLYACFQEFARRCKTLVAWDTPKTRELLGDHPNCHWVSDADIPDDLAMPLPGAHNRINATLAIAMAAVLGVSRDEATRALSSFHGVDRRMSVRFQSDTVTVIEDYAHHPTEVRAALQALHEAYPGHRLQVVFQPHRFERIARYSKQFSDALSTADEVIVTAPFAAWVDNADLSDPAQIAEGITAIPARYFDGELSDLADDLASSCTAGTVIAVLGAGSITKLLPLLIDNLRGET